MNILSVIMEKPLLYLCGFLICVIIGLFAWGKVTSLRLEKCQKEKTNLEGQIKLQNKLILDWQAQAEMQKKRVEAAKKETDKIKKESAKKIEDILKVQLPVDCQEKEKWLDEQLQLLRSQW